MTRVRRDQTFDLVVVGSGAGAMSASLFARRAGKSVVILEKQSKVGGSSGYSGGVFWIPNNPLMRREGVADSFERACAYLDALANYEGPAATKARRDAYVHTGAEVVAFLEALGMKFRRIHGYADYYDELPGGHIESRTITAQLFDLNELGEWKDRLSTFPGAPVRFDVHEGEGLRLLRRSWRSKWTALQVALRYLYCAATEMDIRGTGGAVQGRLLQIALREGVEIWPNTPVSEILMSSGRVHGVLAEKEGVGTSILARQGVLLNVGGFSHNLAMREKTGPLPRSSEWTASNPGDTGEMIVSAQNLGAAVDCMDEAWWSLMSFAPDSNDKKQRFAHHWDISLPHSMVVDQDGRRFANEAACYMEVVQRMYARHRETGRAVPVWAILDHRHRQRYPWGMTFGTPQRWIDSGYMKKASSLEELATQCGIDGEGLKRSVARFNDFCGTGNDLEFKRGARAFDRYHGDPSVKPNPNLGPLEHAPFYAVAMYPGDTGTCGGLVTNEYAQVLDERGAPIAGLYATGNSTASVFGRSQPGAGVTIGNSLVFGYIAARHALRSDKV